MESLHKQYILDIIGSLNKIDYIKPKDIPNIDLYMDQVTTFMDKHLESSKRFDDDKLLTKTMINNYTKNDLLPSPEKKKYTKDHMFLLIFIYYMKNILSISDIQKVLSPLTEMFYGKSESGISLENVYEEVFKLEDEQSKSIAKDIIRKFERSKTFFGDTEGTSDEEQDFLQTFSFICMLCFDVYVKKQMIEAIIDEHQLFAMKDTKETKEKNKPSSKKEAEASDKQA